MNSNLNFLTFLTTLLVIKSSTAQDEMLKVLHLSAFHSSYEPVKHGKIVQYGIARIAKFVKQQKELHPSTIFIDTMDWFTGSIWYTVHRANVTTHFYNILPIDIIGMGHEEPNACKTPEERTKNFTEFIVSIKDKVIVCANCHVPDSSPMHPIIKKSTVLEVKGFELKVGVTAFVRKKLVWEMTEGGMSVSDEFDAVDKEVEKMTQDGIKVIIVVAHGQASFNSLFTAKLKNVDLVIGGHSHQLLYNGRPPSKDVSSGDYPLKVTGRDGSTIPIVYCGCYGRYVGELNLFINKEGRVTSWNGNPVHMGSDREEDEETVALMREFKTKVDVEKGNVLGQSRVYLNHSCYWEECNFGNFVADTFVDYAASQYPSSNRYWTDSAIALIRGKYFSADITPERDENYTITVADILASVVIYENLYTLTLNGSILRQAMEYAASDDDDETTARFLQVSGLRVIYDLNRDVNDRVVKLSARCAACEIPEYLPVEDTKEYKVIMVYVLTNGYANFDMLKAMSSTRKSLKISDIDVIKRYIKSHKVIQPAKDERIIVHHRKDLKLRSLDTSGVIKCRTCYLLYALGTFPFAMFLDI